MTTTMNENRDSATGSTNDHARVPWLAKSMTHLAPGLGHLYCGQAARGLAIYFGGGLILPLILLTIMLSPPGVSWILLGMLAVGVAVWLFAASDIKKVLKTVDETYRPQPYDRWWLYLLIAIQPLGYIIPASLLVRNHLLEAFVIAGDSMSPALRRRDRVLVDKRHAGATEPQRGDVVVFRAPGSRERIYVKRVVGLPGETVKMDEQGRVVIEGAPVEYRKLDQKPAGWTGDEVVEEAFGDVRYRVQLAADGAEAMELQVPPEHVFLLGDNRGKSRDSRHFGVVPVGDVKGPVTFIYAPVGSWSRLGSFSSVSR